MKGYFISCHSHQETYSAFLSAPFSFHEVTRYHFYHSIQSYLFLEMSSDDIQHKNSSITGAKPQRDIMKYFLFRSSSYTTSSTFTLLFCQNRNVIHSLLYFMMESVCSQNNDLLFLWFLIPTENINYHFDCQPFHLKLHLKSLSYSIRDATEK